MKPVNFTNLLESGAVLRVAPNNWFLLEGPFEAQKERPVGKAALFYPDFFMESLANYWIPESFYRLTDQEMSDLLISAPSSELAPLPWQGANFENFQRSYEEIKARIQQGDLRKAVPVSFEKSTESIGPGRLSAMLKELLKAPANLYVFGFWQGGHGVLGATPEVLLQQEGPRLKTMALAGTCPKADRFSRNSLLEDSKERYEHDLVVKDIVERLAVYGNTQACGPEVLELPTLLHLKTEIDCEVFEKKAFSFYDACRALHPTPALGVFPRSYGVDWLKELPEQSLRGGFGAPFGFNWSEEDALCLVAIRSLLWDPSGSRIGAGCGIVLQSDLQQEWRELSQKRQSVKKILGLEL